MRAYLFAGMVVAAGCGNNVADVEDFLSQMASTQCGWQFRCCTDGEIQQTDGRKYKTESDCEPFKVLALENQLYLEKLAAGEGRVRVDHEYATACIQQLTNRACNPKPGMPTPVTNPNDVDPCTKVFVGATAVGNACIYASECVPGARCVADATTVGRGVCVPYQQADEICNSDADCDPTQKNLYCAQKDYHCRFRGKLGEPCAYTFDTTGSTPRLPMLLECNTLAGLYCEPRTGTCAALPGDGALCLSPLPPGVAYQCNPDPALQLVCDTSGTGAGVCRAPGGPGADCTSRVCQTGLICDTSAFPYTCAQAPDLGMPCRNYQCRKPYFCDTTPITPVCAEPASFGESCSSIPCGDDLWCDTAVGSTCKYKFPDGQPCSGSSLECLSNNCMYDSPTGRYMCAPGGLGGVLCVGRAG